MTPEEFDIDFDFDKEYGLSPDLDDKGTDSDDFDLDAALERELGPDFDALFEEEFAAAQAALNAELAARKEEIPHPEEEEEEDDAPQSPLLPEFFDFDYMDDEEEVSEEEAVAEEAPEPIFAAVEEAAADELAADDAANDEADDEAAADEALPMEEAEPEAPVMPRRERRERGKGIDLSAIGEKVNLKGVGEKVAQSGVGEKFSAAGQVIGENGRRFVDALKVCKPGKMDRKAKRRFKDDVLPVLIGGAAVIVCLIFIIGALGRAFNSEERQQEALKESIAQADAEAAAAAEIQKLLHTAAVQAAGYDYQAAIDTLDSYKNAETGRELTEEMTAARASYAEALNSLVIWDDPTAITNLSFHPLIADSGRAYSDSKFAGSYKSNFVTTDQFSSILEQLYANGYVLVNLDSCLTATTDAAGNTTYAAKPIYLPEGKTPIMITETLVNYFDYMVDSDGDNVADKGGAGFANRLVLDNGKVKAEYVDAEGNLLTGDYDLVPILNSFIEAHPDFSYRGAKAILAVTGDEGVFGWRTNTGDASLVSGAQKVAEALRADGYQIACNSYSNIDYGSTSTTEISADLNKWTSEIVPILGEVDIVVIARGGSITADTANTRFGMMYDAGFRCFIDSASTPGAELTADFFYQNRLMVVGSNLGGSAYAPYFTLTSA